MMRGILVQKQEPVIIKGFLVLSSLPSKSLLNTILPKTYRDEEIGKEVIRVIRGYFYNKLGSLSNKFYKILKKHGVWAGFGYIIPSSSVAQFMDEIDDLKNDYRKYEEELRNFLLYGEIPNDIDSRAKLYPDYLETVKEYLRERGISEIQVPNVCDRVRINLLPIRIDREIIEEYIDERVSEEIEKTKREIAEKVSKEIDEKINALLDRLRQYENKRISRKIMRKLKKDAQYIVDLAKDIGVSVDRINKLMEMIETIEEAEKFPDVETHIVAEGRLKALLKEF